MSELPQGWVEAPLEQLCDFNPRHSLLINRNIAVSFVPMPAVCDHKGIILSHETRLLEQVWKGYTHFQDEDIIFAKITPCMENGKIAVARELHNSLACGSTEFHVLRSLGVVLPDYLWRFLRQEDFRKEAERHMTGAVGQRRVPVQFLKEIKFPVPPLPEQRRIVAKLDSLFSRSHRACEELERIPKLIERYKRAVLAAAFRGDLTANWRKENSISETAKDLLIRLQWQQGIIKEFISDTDLHRNRPCAFLPSDWCWAQVKDIGEVFLGRQRSPKNHNGFNMRSYVRAANITWNGWDLSDIKEMNFDDRDFIKYRLKPGDVLVNEGSGSADEVGKPVIWNEEIENCCFQNTLICVRPFESMSRFLYFVFLHAARSRIFVEKTRGVNIFHIGKERLSQFKFALPPLIEQKEIVQRIEKLFKQIDRIEQEYQKASKLCDRLEQATLSKAFRGELVPQNPEDEPVAVLLERIRTKLAERESKAKGAKKPTDKKTGQRSRKTKQQDSEPIQLGLPGLNKEVERSPLN